MKAWLWSGDNQLSCIETNVPTVRDGWVLIKVNRAGVCATDNHIVRGRFDNGKPPHILGHEIAGVVVELGKNVPGEWLHKRITVETAVGCGTCIHCRTANKHLCDEGAEIGYPPYQGGYAQYTTAPYTCLHEIPESVSDDAAGILEAVACPVGAIWRLGMKPGDTVLINGSGIAGLSFLCTCKLYHAGKVIMAVRRDIKRQQAEAFGADVVVDIRKENLVEAVMRETQGSGVDLSIDAAGTPETVETCVHAARKNGRVLLYGLPDANKRINFPVTEIIMRQLTLHGVTNNELIWDPLLQLVAKGAIPVEKMVTHHFTMNELPKALNMIENREETLIKGVLHPWEE